MCEKHNYPKTCEHVNVKIFRILVIVISLFDTASSKTSSNLLDKKVFNVKDTHVITNILVYTKIFPNIYEHIIFEKEMFRKNRLR